MKALLLTLVLCYSCTRYATVDRGSVGTRINDVRMDISHLKDVDWYIGKRKEAKVSQSFTFSLGLPRLTDEDLEYLQKNSGADSWIVRIIQVRGSEVQDLGSLYALFKPKQAIRGISGSAASIVALKVYYAASYASERFRRMKCPPFGHNRLITSLEVKGEDKPFDLYLGQATAYGEKSQLVQLSPSSFNGGHVLQAEYYLEIAPYDSNKKQILASFKRVPRYIEIREEVVDSKSCSGVRPDLN